MASQRRMISSGISTSARLAEVGTFAKLLFTWLVPHCDDVGRMEGAARIVKATVVPTCDESTEEVEDALKSLEKAKLIVRYEVEGKKYIQVTKWDDHQVLKTDRPLRILYPSATGLEPTGTRWNQTEKQEKRREGNVREGKRREEKGVVGGNKPPLENTVKYLDAVPAEDIKAFHERFVASEKEIRGKAEDLKLYCERRGKVYKNYRSFLLGALRRDFKERDGNTTGKYK